MGANQRFMKYRRITLNLQQFNLYNLFSDSMWQVVQNFLIYFTWKLIHALNERNVLKDLLRNATGAEESLNITPKRTSEEFM